MMVKYENLICN